MRIGILILTGLATPVADTAAPDDWNGLELIANQVKADLEAQGHEVEFLVHAWDETLDAESTFNHIFTQVTGGDFDLLLQLAHSFGAALGHANANWLASKHPGVYKVDRSVYFDIALNGPKFGNCQWCNSFLAAKDNSYRPRLPSIAAPFALHFYQRGGRPMGVMGTPFFERYGVTNVDLTHRKAVRITSAGTLEPPPAPQDFGDGPEFDHNSMIREPAIQAMAVAYLLGKVVEATVGAGVVNAA